MMKYSIFFISLAVIINVVYIILIYTLYIPGLNRFERLQCTRINETNSKTIINCKKIIFNKDIDGSCFFDKSRNTIVKFDIQWVNLIIVFGAISALSILFLLLYFTKIFINKIRKTN